MPRKSAKNTPSAQTADTPAVVKPKATARPRVAKQQPATKAATVLAALQRPSGTTIAELIKATGWQAHSVRGYLSGTVRKKLGLAVISETSPKGRIYRIASASAGNPT